MHAGSVLTCLAMFATFQLPSLAQRFPFVTSLLFTIALSGFVAYELASMGGVERLFAMAVHLACSVLVVRAVARRQVGWLIAAIGLHAATNAAIMGVGARAGAVAGEGIGVVFGVVALLIVWGLRETGGEGPRAPVPAADSGPAGGAENT